MSHRWRLHPGDPVHLAKIDPASTDGAPGDRKETKREIANLGKALQDYQRRLWAEKRTALLVVLQGMDTSGKDGTIRHVFGAMDPQGVHVTSFRAPTEEELAHDFLWRIHKAAPALGDIGVFNRSHYEDVVTVRVLDLVPDKVWRERYDLINGFEAALAHGGTTIVKLFLHISHDEQKQRLHARIDDPTKRWKFTPEDVTQRKRWDDFVGAYEETLERTSTEHAPWHVIPADRKWYRNWAVSNVLIDVLQKVDPAYPDPRVNPESFD